MYLKVSWNSWNSYFIYVDYDIEFINSSLQEQTPFSGLASPDGTRATKLKAMQMLLDL